MNACEKADEIRRSVAKTVTLLDSKSLGVTKELECF